MRWYVEVSRVGENTVADEYCVEAKQWQAALQEARKLRGDSGALSKFSIELLDRGYRAVDPSLKLRYLINEAPADAKLSEESGNGRKVGSSSGKLRSADPVAQTAFATSVAPSVSSVAVSSAVPRPASLVPRPNSVAPRPASVPAPRTQQLIVPDDPVPPAPPLPGAFAAAAAALKPSVPVFELVRERAEEPRPESPITYREFAYAVQPGTTRPEVEALLHDRYQATLATLEGRPPGKFVQLAVFDHVFKRRPERAPLATFAWKDWRGSPVLAFPGFGEAPMGPMSQVPPAASMPPSHNGVSVSAPPPASLMELPLPPSLAPAAVAAPAPPVAADIPAIVAPAAAVASASVVPDSAPVVPMAPVVFNSAPAPVSVESAPASAAPVIAAPEPATVSAAQPVVAAPLAPEPLLAAELPAPAPSFELNFESTPFNTAPERKSSPERASRPRLAVGRRRAGEDLISELFEIMHELHFTRDVAAGADFVLSVLNEVLPCEGALIHVFDINTSHFVVVRAKGPNASAMLLERMPDQDPLVSSVMRSPRALLVKDASQDPRFTGARWARVGVVPKTALCGAVQQGGRYLGLIELVNPQGDAPFHLTELNALDYICEQFAEFLSKKPIVLTADVVLARV